MLLLLDQANPDNLVHILSNVRQLDRASVEGINKELLKSVANEERCLCLGEIHRA